MVVKRTDKRRMVDKRTDKWWLREQTREVRQTVEAGQETVLEEGTAVQGTGKRVSSGRREWEVNDLH